RHARPRPRWAWYVKARFDARHIGEPRDKADNVYPIGGRGVQRDDLTLRAPRTRGDFRKIWTELAAVAHTDVDQLPVDNGTILNAARELLQIGSELLAIDVKGV